MLENPGGEYDYNGSGGAIPTSRLIYWAGGNPFHHHQDLNRLRRAWARVETIVVHEPWWTARRAARRYRAAGHHDAGARRHRLLRARPLRARDEAGGRRRRARRATTSRSWPTSPSALGVRDRFTEQRDEPAWLRYLYGRWRQQLARHDIQAAGFRHVLGGGRDRTPAPRTATSCRSRRSSATRRAIR